ncbi:MAG: hypothetical protein CMJ84_03370 [Planctomycetes bacterium]|nr:hypothetical protein [Planctomycetota bacterium]
METRAGGFSEGEVLAGDGSQAERHESEDVVFVGDVHLGRRPVGLDDALGELGLSARELSPAAALANLTDHLNDKPARAVVFAGDLVDQADDRFEAYAILEREVRRLREREIPILAVAGNHDSLVLPRLIERVDGVRQLGRGGIWECHALEGDGPALDLLGWSFPKGHHQACPLDEPSYERALAELRSDATAIGVLHCDLNAGASAYAPVPRPRLEQAPLAAWLLGHIHRPAPLAADLPIGYLGSLVGLDPNETGMRGPWRVRTAGGTVQARQVTDIAPLRWITLDVPVNEAQAASPDDLHTEVEAAVRERLAEEADLTSGRLRAIVARVRLTGRLAQRRSASTFAREHRPQDGVLHLGQVSAVIAKVEDGTTNAVDLAALAGEPSPLGEVARRILSLEERPTDELIEPAREVRRELARASGDLDEKVYPQEPLEEVLSRAAWRVLDLLIAQRDGGAGK